MTTTGVPLILLLSAEERTFLADLLGMWIEGHQDAKDGTIEDPTISSPEELLDLVHGLEETNRMAMSLRERIRNGGNRD